MPALLTIVETELFLARARKLMTEEERAGIADLLAAQPDAGVVIPGSGGLRKLRIGLQGRGKRGGGRVIYWFHSPGCPAVLLWAFAKNEAADLTPAQRKVLAVEAAGLVEDFGGKA